MSNKTETFAPQVTRLNNGGTREVTEDGNILYKNESGEYHRDSVEGPAVIILDTCVEFWVDGQFHRPIEEGPAVIWANGAYKYLERNRRHNTKGPAIWSPYRDDMVGCIVKFIQDGKVINDKDICGPYFLEAGDQYYDLLKEDENDHDAYLVLGEKIIEGKTGFFTIKEPNGKERLSNIIFMTKKIDINVHETYRLPQEKYDEINWEAT